jgi:hypothetical protein
MTTVIRPVVVTPSASGRMLSRTNLHGVFEEHACQQAGELWYYDPRIETAASPSVYAMLAATAHQSVWIWDPYLNEGDFGVLRSLRSGISFRLLFEGSCHSLGVRNKTDLFAASFRDAFPEVTLQIACLDRDVYTTRDPALCFHDRYLFVDENVYSVGGSLEAHRRRQFATAVVKIQDKSASQLLRYEFLNYWNDPKLTKHLV